MKKMNEQEMRTVIGGATYYHCDEHSKKNMSYWGAIAHNIWNGLGCWISSTSYKK